MVLLRLEVKPLSAYAVSHPSAPLRRPTNKGRYRLPFCYEFVTATVMLTQAKASVPAASRANRCLWHVSYQAALPDSRAQYYLVVLRVAFHSVAKSAGAYRSGQPHHVLILQHP